MGYRRKYRSDSFIILRFLVLLFDLPAIASRSGEAGGYSGPTPVGFTAKGTKFTKISCIVSLCVLCDLCG
jgi:hypothetical protein